MVRRVVTDDRAVGSYDETRVVAHRSVASVIRSVLTVVYVAVVSIVGLDALLRALGARRSSGFVSAIHSLASPLVAPFRGIFANQNDWATALIAAVVYTIVYLVAMAALGRDRTY
jgi:uncharacterized protein YggT (Ycf19 family)